MKTFIDELASKSPTPSGGGATALIGSIGTALCSMVCSLTVGKKKYEEYESEVLEVLEESTRLQNRLLELIKEDEENFLPLSKAYSLKSTTDEEKKIKEETMEKCLKLAAKTPLELIDVCYESINLHKKILGKTTILAISDIGVGVQALRCAVLSSKINVLINLNGLKDEDYKKLKIGEMERKVSSSIKLCDEIYKEVLNYL